MAKSSAPKPPRIAPTVRAEALVAPVFAAVVITLAWNFLVAPNAPVGTLNLFAVLGGAVILNQLAVIAGYAFGHGTARQEIAENEVYGELAAEFLSEIEAQQRAALDQEIAANDAQAPRRGGGGQG